LIVASCLWTAACCAFHTLGDLLERYAAVVVPRKRGADRERYMLRVVLRHPMARLSLDRLTSGEVAKYRNDRLAAVSGDTVRRELAIVGHCLEVARHETRSCAARKSGRAGKVVPPPSHPRERRTTAIELEWLLAACQATCSCWLAPWSNWRWRPGCGAANCWPCGRRTWTRWPGRCSFELLKNGHPRTVPLSPRALENHSEYSPCR